MQNGRNQNLLKLWLSFFCLSLANALASDSVGKIHAVHVNEVIRIKIIQSQRFSLWNICTGSLMDICHTNYYPHSKGQEGPVDAKTQRWDWASPLHLWSISSHTSQSDFHDGNVSHGGPDSARYLRTTNCWNPTYLPPRLHTYPTGAEPEEQHVYGIAACSGCDTGRSQRLCSPKLRLHPSVARAHTSPQHSRDNLSDLLKIVYFPATLTVPITWMKKRWKIQHLS